MKKIITLISILLLISISACADGSSNTLGPNNGGNNTEENETGSQIRHIIGSEYCMEYEVRENAIYSMGKNEGKCPTEYSIKCAKFYNNMDRKIIEQAMFPKSAGENACEWYGGLDDGYVHHY